MSPTGCLRSRLPAFPNIIQLALSGWPQLLRSMVLGSRVAPFHHLFSKTINFHSKNILPFT